MVRSTGHCTLFTDWLDIAEQSVGEVLADLRTKVVALRDSPADLSRFGWRQGVSDVLALIDEVGR